MLNFIVNNLKEIILYSMLGLCIIYTGIFLLAKKIGQYTDIDWDEIEKTHDKNKRN